MKTEIHIYLGNSVATEKINSNYRIGDRHAFLLFLRYESETEFFNDDAISCLENLGWKNTFLKKSGKLYDIPVKEEFKEPYQLAIENGSAIVFYTEPENNKST